MAITTFVASQILTAAQMNAVQSNDFNQTVSTKTASYTLVAADKGTRIVMNVTGASTVTVNTSLFSAGDTLTIQNISATACTVTAGTATVSSAGPLAIPQNGSGLLYFTSAGVSIFYPSAVTAAAATSGLNFITGATFTTATSFSLPNNTFSATYLNYRLIVNLSAVVTDADFSLRVRASGTDNTTGNYFDSTTGFLSTNSASNVANGNATSWNVGESDNSSSITYNLVLDILQPNTTNRKSCVGQVSFLNKAATAFVGRSLGLAMDIGTAVDSLTFISSVASSITGKYRVYGYSES